jgi:hypothetical protein
MVFKFSFKRFIHVGCEKIQTKSIVFEKLFKRIFFSQPSFKKGLQDLLNLTLIGSKFQHSFISLLYVSVKVFLYPE